MDTLPDTRWINNMLGIWVVVVCGAETFNDTLPPFKLGGSGVVELQVDTHEQILRVARSISRDCRDVLSRKLDIVVRGAIPTQGQSCQGSSVLLPHHTLSLLLMTNLSTPGFVPTTSFPASVAHFLKMQNKLFVNAYKDSNCLSN